MKMPKRERRGKLMGEVRTTIEAKEDHVAIVIQIKENVSLGIRLVSPEHVFTFIEQIVDAAANIWPQDEHLKAWLDADDGYET